MSDQRKKFKPSPKRFHPKGITILYEDYDILVIEKMNGLLTMTNENTHEETVYSLLTEYVKKGNSKSRNRIFIVHRLDRDTSGVLVFAKTEFSKRKLQDDWKSFSKTYYAIIQGVMAKKEGIISSYLMENSIYKMYSSTDTVNGKLAKTQYKVESESENYSLVKVNLLTGRKNQIRVHFADENHPVVGDKVYGSKEKGIKRLCLHAYSLSFNHPITSERMTIETKMPEYFTLLLSA